MADQQGIIEAGDLPESFFDLDRNGNLRDDDTCIAIFSWDAKPDPERTRAEGRQCYKQVPMVEILIPGDTRNIVKRQVQGKDKDRWPNQWRRFVETSESIPDGTPIEKYPLLDKARIAEFRHYGVHTVEALVNISEGNADKLGPDWREIREQAATWLKGQSDATAAAERANAKLEAENAELKSRLSALEATVAKLTAAAKAEPAEPAPARKRGPGRPRKPRVVSDEPTDNLPGRGA